MVALGECLFHAGRGPKIAAAVGFSPAEDQAPTCFASSLLCDRCAAAFAGKNPQKQRGMNVWWFVKLPDTRDKAKPISPTGYKKFEEKTPEHRYRSKGIRRNKRDW
jgi:hypothetical protein